MNLKHKVGDRFTYQDGASTYNCKITDIVGDHVDPYPYTVYWEESKAKAQYTTTFNESMFKKLKKIPKDVLPDDLFQI